MDKERKLIVDTLVSKEARSWIKKSFKTHWKNSKKARLLRIEGNDLFASMPKTVLQMEEIYKLYSQSIAFAECDSEELAFGYGNRSAILLRMQKYEECITDIDSALKLSKSEPFNIKLLLRKVEGMIKLGSCLESIEFLCKAESLIHAMKDEDTNKKTLLQALEKVNNMHVDRMGPDNVKKQEIPKHIKFLNKKENENPFDSVSVRWDKKYGRHLVANRDFKPGEIIFVEKPYIKVANVKKFFNICGHCLAISWATIPCNSCSWCMFCSEDCKKAACELYHNIECVVVEQIIKRQGGISRYDQLAIRALLLGVREAGSVQNLKEEIENIDACTDKCAKGFQKNGSFQCMGMKSMYILNDDAVISCLSEFTSNSAFILISLIRYTSLFNEKIECNLENLLLNDEVLFVGSLLLKLYKITESNCQQLPGENECKYSNDIMTCKTRECCTPGFCITIINSLINNDCHPQVSNVISKKSYKFVVCSIRPIKKNSQIFINYCGNFYDLPKNERQAILQRGFNFTCKCQACEENWPTMEEQMMLLQKNRTAFFSKCNPKESYYIDVEAATVMPILTNDCKAEYTLNTVKTVSNVMCRLYKELRHPSFSLWRLERCMFGIVEKLYEDC